MLLCFFSIARHHNGCSAMIALLFAGFTFLSCNYCRFVKLFFQSLFSYHCLTGGLRATWDYNPHATQTCICVKTCKKALFAVVTYFIQASKYLTCLNGNLVLTVLWKVFNEIMMPLLQCIECWKFYENHFMHCWDMQLQSGREKRAKNVTKTHLKRARKCVK